MSRYRHRPADLARFDGPKAAKVDVTRGASLLVGLNCFEPGQSQPVHAHRGADKFYLILSGKARMSVGDESFDAVAGDLAWAPADVPHGVLEVFERTVMMIGMAPPP